MLPRLSPANLVTGANGIGKTALLEAIWLFTGRYNPMLLWNANVQRSSAPVLDPVGRLSRRGVLELRGVEDGSPRRLRSTFEKVADIVRPVATGEVAERNRMQLPVTGRIRTHLDDDVPEGRTDGLLTTPWGLVEHRSPVSPAMRPNCVIEGMKFQSETSGEYLQRYSDMVRENRKEEFTNAIRLMLPGVSNVEILTDGMGASYLSAVTTDGLQLPLHDLGGGAVRLSRLLLSFFSSRDGLLLTDEIENGVHHSVLNDVWTFSRQWMRQWNVQLVATTHSDECIRAAMDAFEDAPDDLSIHRLFLNETTGRVEATTFTGESLEGAHDLSLELR